MTISGTSKEIDLVFIVTSGTSNEISFLRIVTVGTVAEQLRNFPLDVKNPHQSHIPKRSGP